MLNFIAGFLRRNWGYVIYYWRRDREVFAWKEFTTLKEAVDFGLDQKTEFFIYNKQGVIVFQRINE